MLFTNTQQSFKFSSFIKKKEGRGKRVGGKPNEPNKKKKKTNQNTEKKQKQKQTQINNTTVSL